MIVTTLAPAHEEFKNDEVLVRIHRKPACKVEMEVHASPAMIQKARQKAVKVVGKNVAIPGFRKGKAPEEMIEKKFGSQIDQETGTQLADLAYVEAQKLAQVPRLNNSAKISFQMKKEAELSFTFETEPAVPSVDGMQFEAKPVPRAEVAEKQIEEAIRQMRYFFAEWTLIEDRPIQDGDTIMINLETVEDDGTSQRVFDHVRFEVSKDRMANWMKALVAGAKSGDVLEGVSEPDDTATEEEKKEFKPKKVRITVLKVEEAKLPELNDELAKKVGVENTEAMRKSITDMLNKQADQKVLDEMREQVNEFLVKTPFELPYSLIETERKHRLEKLIQNPQFAENWQKMSVGERKAIEKNLETESADAVRLFYLSRKVVNDAKLSITHKEIQDEAIATLRSFGESRIEKIPKEVYALALSKIILVKAQDHILAQKK